MPRFLGMLESGATAVQRPDLEAGELEGPSWCARSAAQPRPDVLWAFSSAAERSRRTMMIDEAEQAIAREKLDEAAKVRDVLVVVHARPAVLERLPDHH